MSIKNRAIDRAPSPGSITIPQREERHPLNTRSAESPIQLDVRLPFLSSCNPGERLGNVAGDLANAPVAACQRVVLRKTGGGAAAKNGPGNRQQTKRSACSRTAVGAHGRLARFHDASPGAGRPPGPTGPRLFSQHSTRGYDRGSARLSRSSASPLTPLPSRRATWLSFHSDSGSLSYLPHPSPLLCRPGLLRLVIQRSRHHYCIRCLGSHLLSVCFSLLVYRFLSLALVAYIV